MTVAVTDATLDANAGVFVSRYRELQADICDIIHSHGFNPCRIRAVTFDVIDAPLLRMQVILDDDDGQPLLNDTGDVICECRDTLLRTDLPAWWTPTV